MGVAVVGVMAASLAGSRFGSGGSCSSSLVVAVLVALGMETSG